MKANIMVPTLMFFLLFICVPSETAQSNAKTKEVTKETAKMNSDKTLGTVEQDKSPNSTGNTNKPSR